MSLKPNLGTLTTTISSLCPHPRINPGPIIIKYPMPMSSLSKSLLFLHPKRPFHMANRTIPRARLRGVVFDMDGTLTVPAIDFAAMYKAVLGDDEFRRIKAENPSGIDILHHIENWSPDKQLKAYETIADYERQGLDRLQIMPGLPFLYSYTSNGFICSCCQLSLVFCRLMLFCW
jgi:hypothetical protein